MSAALLSLDKVKALLGLPTAPAPTDPQLTAALPVITEYFEGYCARGLAFVADAVEEKQATRSVALFRFPVDTIAELLIDGVAAVPPPIAPQLDQTHGIIRLYCGWPHGCALLRVTYSGGYPEEDVPADLADAFARCCADYAGVVYASGGGGGGGAPLKSLGLGSGALTVAFETGAASVFDTSSVPAILAPYLFVLNHYQVKDYV